MKAHIPHRPDAGGGLDLRIYVDADACPVKPEIYRVAARYGLPVTLVAGKWMSVPADGSVTLEVVEQGFDAADDWIVEHVERRDIVITTDIPLAARCLEKTHFVLGPTGRAFTRDNIGDAVATRQLLTDLRGAGVDSGGPAPFAASDRSRFLQELDRMVHAARREG